MKIITLTHPRREPVIESHLSGIEHERIINADWLTVAPRPFDWLNPNPLGAYRCWQAHRLACQSLPDAPGLIFEDDCRPNRGDWLELARSAASLLQRFDVVSLHARIVPALDVETSEDFAGLNLVTLRERERATWCGPTYCARWALGSLAYLISTEAARRLAESQWDGYPVDLLLANRFNFAAIYPSPFDHVDVPSLVESAK